MAGLGGSASFFRSSLPLHFFFFYSIFRLTIYLFLLLSPLTSCKVVFLSPPTFSIEENDLGVVNLGTAARTNGHGRITFDTRIIGELDTLAYRWPILESFAGVSVLLLAPLPFHPSTPTSGSAINLTTEVRPVPLRRSFRRDGVEK